MNIRVRDGAANSARLALSSAQTPIWLDGLFFPDKPIANTGAILILQGHLDEELFARALEQVVAESDNLRVRLSMEREQVRQEVVSAVSAKLERRDFSQQANAEDAARLWLDGQFWTPLSWNDFPLFQFFLAKVGDDRHLWVQKFNHLVIDATGRYLLTQRTLEIYEALENNASAPPKRGAVLAEIIEAEERYRQSGKYQDDRAYWLKRFATFPEPLVQKDRHETERVKSGRSKRLAFDIPAEAFRRLEESAKSLGSTVPRLFLTFVQLVFSRLYGNSDLVLWFALHHRMTPHLKQTIGMFSQNIPLRLDVDLKTSLRDAVKQVGSSLSEGREHSQFPPSELAALLQVARHESGLYDALVNYVPAPEAIVFHGKPVEIANLSSGFLNAWAIILTELGANRGARFIVDYDPGLIAAGEAARFARALNVLLNQEIIDPAQPIGALPMLEESERNRLLHDFNNTAAPVPTDATLVSLCETQAARSPNAVALVHGTEHQTFSSLHERAGKLARALVRLGVGSDTIVGVALPRGFDLIAGVLGVHKAGGAYVPLDPAYPAERIAYIVEDARAPVIVTTSAISPLLPQTNARLVLLDELWAAPDDGLDSIALPAVRPENLAYVLYTSGSTGKPKGVGVEHRNVVNLLFAMRAFIGPEDLEGVLFATSFNFDISLYEIFMPLIFGGRMIIVENLLDVFAAPAAGEVRLINTGPSFADALLRIGSLPENTRTINLAGEALPRSLADRIFAAAPGVRLMNAYGPTETTIYSTAVWVDKTDPRPPTIGRPLWNTQAYVLDRAGSLLPLGATGELYIAGAGVSRGYLSRPDLTQERFPENPFAKDPLDGGRMYRTGDLVKWRSDGELEFSGRADHQIKIHGQRVELGEIEDQLQRVPGVASAVAIARADKFGNAVHAYLIPQPEQAKPSLEAINTELMKFLPRHMLPSTVTWLKKFPMTPNGKLDRRALPEPDVKGVRAVRRAAESAIELTLERIWKDVLQIEDLGIDDDFYELGGTSLQAFMIFSKVKAAVGLDLPPSVMIQAANIAAQADILAQKLKPETTGTLVPFRATGSGEPVFFVHGAGGGCMFVRELLPVFTNHRPVFGLQAPALDQGARLPRTIEAIATGYLADVRKKQPRGPYFLAGYSFGGWIAYEMARQLSEEGERVDFLGMIDASIAGRDLKAQMQHHLRQLRKESLSSYLLPRLRKTVQHHLRAGLDAVAELPNEIRHALGRPIPYEKRVAFYRHVSDGAIRRYVPKPYDGNVVVFGRTGLLDVHYARWRALATGGVTMREIPAGHRELVWAPFSTLLAQQIDSFLISAPR